MEFAFDSKKNEVLMAKRGVTFPMVIESVAEKGVLADFANPNQDKYPEQRVLVVELEGTPIAYRMRLKAPSGI
jgi:uncharacterized DUF497 family protein